MPELVWTPKTVAEALDEAARTLRRLPPVIVRGYVSSWPPIIRELWEAFGWHETKVRLGPPAPDAIDRWKDECRRRGLLDPKSQAEQRSKDAERAYFNKYKLKLFERNVARQHDHWVWLCEPGETRPKPR